MACASVVFPTPGTSSIKRCPRASRQTAVKRTTSGFPRMGELSDISSSFSFDSATGAASITVIVSCRADLPSQKAPRQPLPRSRGAISRHRLSTTSIGKTQNRFQMRRNFFYDYPNNRSLTVVIFRKLLILKKKAATIGLSLESKGKRRSTHEKGNRSDCGVRNQRCVRSFELPVYALQSHHNQWHATKAGQHQARLAGRQSRH